ncbi:MAG: YfbM family protein [Spirochaetales bacterium]|jgi:hypothetical protein|nr:YfbM family protein [Spirochaetales bacterium]
MDAREQKDLDTFIEDIVRRQAQIEDCQKNGMKAKKLLEMQTELSGFITDTTRKLMAAGLGITGIQNALRAAPDRVPNSYASDADEDDDAVIDEDGDCDDGDYDDDYAIDAYKKNGKDFSEKLSPEQILSMKIFTVFAAVDKELITAFEEGRTGGQELMDEIGKANTSVSLKGTETISLVAGNYREDSGFDNISGGEILAGPDGQAFLPEWFEVKDENGCRSQICEPLVYKDAEEVWEVCALARKIDEKTFFRQFDIKKLIKADMFPLLDARDVKKHKKEIALSLWESFGKLKDFYEKAAAAGKWAAIFWMTEN